jgi:hypothetical protein
LDWRRDSLDDVEGSEAAVQQSRHPAVSHSLVSGGARVSSKVRNWYDDVILRAG